MSVSASLAIQRRAARLGMSVDELLEKDAKSLREMPLGPLCLDRAIFSDTSSLYNNAQLLRMLGHVLECPMCAALIDMLVNSKKD